MKKDFEKITFKNLDYSRYSKEMEDIKCLVNEIKSDKSLMKKLEKFRSKNNMSFTYNNVATMNKTTKIKKMRNIKQTNISDDTFEIDSSSMFA